MYTEIVTARSTVGIRPTRDGDAVGYRDLRLEALRDHPEAFGMDYAERSARPIAYWEEGVRSGAGNDYGITYLAEAGGALLAMAGIARDDAVKMRHNGMIWGMYVRPAWRGAGLADALIGACVAWAERQQLRVVKLAVVTTNAPAIRCYLRCGFSVYGVDPQVIYHNGVYHDELLMARRLQHRG